MAQTRKVLLANGILTLLFFSAFFVFQFWLEPLSDFPRKDEYQSLLSALHFPVYTPNVYIHWLRFWAHWFPDFFSLWRFDFMGSHLLLAASFFLYHRRKKIAFSTAIVFTSILVLSTINIALTRKMHFWAISAYFVIMILADQLCSRRRLIFLSGLFFLLGFLRMEFFFSSVVALTLFLLEFMRGRLERKYQRLVFAGLGVLLASLTAFFIARLGYGMQDLLRDSLKIGEKSLWSVPVSYLKLFFSNTAYHGWYSLYALVVPLRIFFPGVAIALAFLFYQQESPLKNFVSLKAQFGRDHGPFFLPALVALCSIRFNDYYVIMSFVLLLSLLCFLLGHEEKPMRSLLVSVLILPAFFVFRPELKESAYINFPTFKREVRIQRHVFDLIRQLKVASGQPPLKILIDQYVAGVLPNEGREYALFSDLAHLCTKGPVEFDLVLLPGQWTLPPEQKWIESCVKPGLKDARPLKISPGYDLYLSPRALLGVSAEKMPLK